MLSHPVAAATHSGDMAHVYRPRASRSPFQSWKRQRSRKHRPRSQPTPSGRHTTITDNDIFGIFEPLSRHAQLTTKQIVAFDRRYASNTRNRLTDLYHERGRVAGAIERERSNSPTRFSSTKCIASAKTPRTCSKRAGSFPRKIGCERRASAATAPRPRASFASRTITWRHRSRSTSRSARARRSTVRFRNHIEIIKDAPERTQSFPNPLRVLVPPIPDAPKWIEPDALFAIDDRYFAIEADTGSESIEAVIKPKIRAYREIVASGMIDDHFGIDNLRVLFVTTNEKRMRNMMTAVASIARNGRSTMFGFACRPDLGQLAGAPAPDGRMFHERWAQGRARRHAARFGERR